MCCRFHSNRISTAPIVWLYSVHSWTSLTCACDSSFPPSPCLCSQRPSGMYRLSAYYAARTAADLPMELLLPTLFVIIIYFFGGLRLTAGESACAVVQSHFRRAFSMASSPQQLIGSCELER